MTHTTSHVLDMNIIKNKDIMDEHSIEEYFEKKMAYKKCKMV